MPWKSICIFLLLVVLSGAVVPLHFQKKHKHKKETVFVIEDKSIGGELSAKVLKNTKTGTLIDSYIWSMDLI